MGIEAQTFIGCILTKEIRMHLNQSTLWKEDNLVGKSQLKEIKDNEKEYVGFFIPSFLNYLEIKSKEKELKSHLQLYCPKLNIDPYSTYLLSQLFIR